MRMDVYLCFMGYLDAFTKLRQRQRQGKLNLFQKKMFLKHREDIMNDTCFQMYRERIQ